MIEARKIDPVANPKQFKNALLENGVGKKEPKRIDKLVKFYQDGLFERSKDWSKNCNICSNN